MKPSRVVESCILKGKGRGGRGGMRVYGFRVLGFGKVICKLTNAVEVGFMALGFWVFGKVICKLTYAVEVKGNKRVQFTVRFLLGSCVVPVYMLFMMFLMHSQIVSHVAYNVPLF